MATTGRARRGFTLVEFGALTACAAIAGAVAVPAARSIREGHRVALNANNQGRLGVLQHEYIADHDGRFSGVNTSGLPYNRLEFSGGLHTTWDDLYGDTAPDTPTTIWDWISPIAGFDGEPLPVNRALRMQEIFERYADPRADRYADGVFGSGDDDGDFVNALLAGGFRQVSYLQAHSFIAVGSDTGPVVSVPGEYAQYYYTLLESSPLIPADYRPTIDRVGVSPAMKVMHADGTRYLSGDDFLDIDINVRPGVHSNFADAPPSVDGSIAYGRGAPDVVDVPGNLALSFRQPGVRQNDPAMHATMFDGSVKAFSRSAAWTNPIPWYPSGTVWNPAFATPEANAFVGANLPGGVIP